MSAQHRINPPLSLYKKIALTFVLIATICVAVILYIAISYAYITVRPVTEQVTSDFTFTIAQQQLPGESMARDVFPGSIIDITTEVTGDFPVSEVSVTQRAVSGTIVVRNTHSRDQILVATTRFLTPDGVLYRLRDRITVPAGGTISAVIVADNPEQTAVITPGTRFTIPGLLPALQPLIYGESTEAFTGETIERRIVTPAAIASARQSLYDRAVVQAVGETGDKLRILSQELVSESWSAIAGTEADSFTGTVSVRVSGVVFDEAPIRRYAEEALAQLVPSGKRILSVAHPILYEVYRRDPNNTVALVKGTVSGTIGIAETNELFDTTKFMKLNPKVLKVYLENFESIERVDIDFFPSWNKVMPRLPDHIIIRIAD